MTAVNDLVEGKPGRIVEGAPRWGLSSWHLYPDMHVIIKGSMRLRKMIRYVHREESVTPGLQRRRETDLGIIWSLPLACLRYYGDLSVRRSSVNSHTSRVSIDQLIQVAFGSLLCFGGVARQRSNRQLKVMQLLWLRQLTQKSLQFHLDSSWLCIFATAARYFLSPVGTVSAESLQLVKAGIRRCKSFMGSGRF